MDYLHYRDRSGWDLDKKQKKKSCRFGISWAILIIFKMFFFFSRCSDSFCQVCAPGPVTDAAVTAFIQSTESCYHLNAHLSIQDFLICKLANVRSTICLPSCFASPLGGTKQ